MDPQYKNRLHQIKAFAFDVDGVFTDGGLIALPGGDLLRCFNAKDGYAIRKLVTLGFKVAIITGGGSPCIPARFNQLGVHEIYLRAEDKVAHFLHFCQEYGLQPQEVAWGGDDIPDVPVCRLAGFAFCPADAAVEMQAAAHYISPLPGGRGCVRDAVEQTLRAQGKWTYDYDLRNE